MPLLRRSNAVLAAAIAGLALLAGSSEARVHARGAGSTHTHPHARKHANAQAAARSHNNNKQARARVRRQEQVQAAAVALPKIEEVANSYLSTSGLADQLASVNLRPDGGFQSDSEVFAAFLTAARDNLEGGSIESYGKGFTELADGDATALFNSAVPGEKVDPSSLMTLSMGLDYNKELTNARDTVQMAFGLDPEQNMADSIGDPAWWAKTVFGAIKGGNNGGFQTDCAWTASADPNTVNLFFPDQQAMYHVMYFSQFGPGDLAMIEGEFPDTRYFSVQTYDDSFSAVASLKDIDVEAYEGVNPFAKKTNLQIRDGRFRIFLSKDGKRGFPNELPMVMGNYSDTSMAFIIFRMYGIDPLANKKNSKYASWGYKNPPTISLRTGGSLTPTTWDQGWTELQQCPESNAATANQAVNTLVQSRVVQIQQDPLGESVSCKTENLKDGFMLMNRERAASSRSPFVNADGAYLMACGNARDDYIKNNDLIAVVRQYMPSTPYSKFQARFVGAPETYEMRYASLSVYDLKPPGPVLKTFSDSEIRDFYYAKYGAQVWEEEMQRNVSLVVATNAAALARCKMDTDSSLVLTLDNLDADQQSFPKWWSIIYRELIPQSSVINETTAASYGMRPADIYTKSVLDARQSMCNAEGTECDKNPYRAASIMKEHFPRVSWYTCSPTGVLAVADPVIAQEFDTRFDHKEMVPRAQQYFYQFCPDDVSEALVKVLGPSTVTLHAAGQKATTAPANTLATTAISLSNKVPAFVVGVSVKAKDNIDAYFKGEIEVCGYSYVTDAKWSCTTEPPTSDAWLTPEFNDAAWERASWVADDYEVPTISNEAKYITLGEGSTGLYCRLVVPNPTYTI